VKRKEEGGTYTYLGHDHFRTKTIKETPQAEGGKGYPVKGRLRRGRNTSKRRSGETPPSLWPARVGSRPESGEEKEGSLLQVPGVRSLLIQKKNRRSDQSKRVGLPLFERNECSRNKERQGSDKRSRGKSTSEPLWAPGTIFHLERNIIKRNRGGGTRFKH